MSNRIADRLAIARNQVDSAWWKPGFGDQFTEFQG